MVIRLICTDSTAFAECDLAQVLVALGRMFTEKYGTHQCMLAVRENVMRTHHATVDDSIINRVLPA